MGKCEKVNCGKPTRFSEIRILLQLDDHNGIRGNPLEATIKKVYCEECLKELLENIKSILS